MSSMSTELAPAPEPEPLVAGRRAWMILGVISFSNFQLDLSLSASSGWVLSELLQYNWVFNVFAIVGAATMVLAGAIGERWGRKRIILLGTAAFMVASVAAALAPNVIVLIAALAVQTLAAVAILPAGVATLVAAFPQNKRGTAIGAWLAAEAAATALGRLLGHFLVGFGGWQVAFWITLPLGAAAFVAIWLVIPEYRLETETKKLLPDPLGSVMLVVGISAIVLAFVQIQDWQWLDVRIIAIGAAGIAVMGWVLWRSKGHPSPILDLKLFNYRGFAYGNAAMALLAFSSFAFQTWGFFFLGHCLGLRHQQGVAADYADLRFHGGGGFGRWSHDRQAGFVLGSRAGWCALVGRGGLADARQHGSAEYLVLAGGGLAGWRGFGLAAGRDVRHIGD